MSTQFQRGDTAWYVPSLHASQGVDPYRYKQWATPLEVRFLWVTDKTTFIEDVESGEMFPVRSNTLYPTREEANTAVAGEIYRILTDLEKLRSIWNGILQTFQGA